MRGSRPLPAPSLSLAACRATCIASAIAACRAGARAGARCGGTARASRVASLHEAVVAQERSRLSTHTLRRSSSLRSEEERLRLPIHRQSHAQSHVRRRASERGMDT